MPTPSRGSRATTRSRSIPARGSSWCSTRPAARSSSGSCCPVPTERTKGVLVFPTVDGKVIAGPTAVDQHDKSDWSVRPRGARGDPSQGRRDVAAARGRRADRGLRRPATGGARSQLPDRALAGVRRARQRRGDPLHRPDRVTRDRGTRLRSCWQRLGVALGPERPLEPGDAAGVAVCRGGAGRRSTARDEPAARHRRGHLGREGDPLRCGSSAAARGAAREAAAPPPAGLGRAGSRGRGQRRRRGGRGGAGGRARRGRRLRPRPSGRVGAGLGGRDRPRPDAGRDMAGQALPGGARPPRAGRAWRTGSWS